MNARVFLLALVTGLFMAAWNGDQAAMEAAVARRDESRASGVARMLSEPGLPYRATTLQTGSAAVRPGHSGSAVARSERTLPFALPAGISAGTYQAVSDHGRTRELVVDAAQATGSVDRDLFITDAADGSRWFLIRQR